MAERMDCDRVRDYYLIPTGGSTRQSKACNNAVSPYTLPLPVGVPSCHCFKMDGKLTFSSNISAVERKRTSLQASDVYCIGD
jgi:hypothetical protein